MWKIDIPDIILNVPTWKIDRQVSWSWKRTQQTLVKQTTGDERTCEG